MNPTVPPSTLHTPGFAHYALAWSPFHSNRLAVASAANYGLIGNGRLNLVSLAPGPTPAPLPEMNLEKQYATQDGLYDIAWSEVHENQIVSASGDGSLRLWDITLNVRAMFYSFSSRYHANENFSRIFLSEYGKNIQERCTLLTGRM